MINFIIDEMKDAIVIDVELSGDLQTYAKSFLHIFNNVRDSSCMYRVENLSGTNRVFVTCDADEEEAATDYLSQFGEILGIGKRKMIAIVPDNSTHQKYREFENLKDRIEENDIRPIFYIPDDINEY